MMMDSYNTHYKNDIKNFSDTPDFSPITPGERRKLFYRYNLGDSGYEVGPCAYEEREYGRMTSSNSVYTDEKIDSVYYPDKNNYYWLASPSSEAGNCVMSVNRDVEGRGPSVHELRFQQMFILPISFSKIFSPIKVEIVVGSAE